MEQKNQLLPENISTKDFIKWLWHFVSNKKLIVAFISLGTIITAFLKSTIPIFIGIIVDEVLAKPIGNIDIVTTRLTTILLTLITIVLFNGILTFLVFAVNDWLAFKVESEVRAEFYESIQSKPLSFHTTTRTGDIMALATNDTRQMSGMISPGIRLVSQLFISSLFVAFMTVGAVDLRFALLGLVFIPFYIWSVKRYSDQLGPISRVFQRQFSAISIRAQDSVIGAKIVRAFSGEDYETEFFSGAVNDFKQTWIQRTKVQSNYFPPLILNLFIATSTIFGVFLVFQGELTLGKLIAFNGLLLTLEGPTATIEFALNIAQSGLAGAARIFTMMSQSQQEETEQQKQAKLDWPVKTEGRIEFRDVTFRYQKDAPEVIHNVTFEVEPGETVALVGATGSGKSTLTKLLLRFYEPEEGKILLDGVNIQNYRLADLRSNIGLIEQDVFLFSTSIKNNIAFGVANASVEAIEQAAKQAQAHDFIMSFKENYNTVVGERGDTLSGGQKQRLALARTFITDPVVLILDDSTSAIDSETEEKIVRAINTIIEDRTSFLITHRVSSIMRADKILVLKKGHLVAQGTHAGLIRTSPDYRRIFSKHTKLPPLQPTDIEQHKLEVEA